MIQRVVDALMNNIDRIDEVGKTATAGPWTSGASEKFRQKPRRSFVRCKRSSRS